MIDTIISVAFLVQVLRITVPYVLAALGGVLSERAGVVALGLEGMLLGGAFGATLASDAAGPLAGVLGGLAAGALLAALYAASVVWLRGDQIVCGIAINLLALGLTRYLLQLVYGSASSTPVIPGLGAASGSASFIVATALLVVTGHGLLYYTARGLRLRAVGEHPAAAASLGVGVTGTRWAAVLGSGALAGLGGAWLALANEGFVDEMSGGRGYIALAAVILGGWRPAWAALACLLFGFTDALQLNLQTHLQNVPRELVQVIPYAVTLVAMCVVSRTAGPGSRAPAALGRADV